MLVEEVIIIYYLPTIAFVSRDAHDPKVSHQLLDLQSGLSINIRIMDVESRKRWSLLPSAFPYGFAFAFWALDENFEKHAHFFLCTSICKDMHVQLLLEPSITCSGIQTPGIAREWSTSVPHTSTTRTRSVTLEVKKWWHQLPFPLSPLTPLTPLIPLTPLLLLRPTCPWGFKGRINFVVQPLQDIESTLVGRLCGLDPQNEYS